MIVTELVAIGIVPMKIMTSAEHESPSAMNTRALLRPETLPMMNLDKTYAMETPDSANPRSAFEQPCSISYSIASVKFFLTT